LTRSDHMWMEAYQAALLELDPKTLLSKVTKAEEFIRSRRAEILQVSNTGDELDAIERALKVLGLLRDIGLNPRL
jgi:hypothetical protein